MSAGQCSREGAHACRSAASHRGRWPWLRGVPYVAHVGDPPSPSGLPLRQAAVAGIVAALRGLPPGDMFAEADRRHRKMWAEFVQKREAAMAALRAGSRILVAAMGWLARLLGNVGLTGIANAAHRRAYGRLGLEAEARNLEEVTAAYTAAIGERIHGGRMGDGALLLFRHAGTPEARSVAGSGVLRHRGGHDHLSFSLYMVEEYRGRPVLLVLGLTGNVMARLRALSYRSLAFAAPGSRPWFRETWAGTKSWARAYECEVRLRVDTPVPARGLDLSVYMEGFPGRRAWRLLRGLCGARKASARVVAARLITGTPGGLAMVMARPARSAAPPTGQDTRKVTGGMPPSPLRNALQLIHVGLLFNEKHGMDVGSVLSSIREKLEVSPRRALGEALRAGLVRKGRDALGRPIILRGSRSTEALRWIYDGEPPTRESVMAGARAWDEFFKARSARLRALREASRPGEHNTVAALPAWVS